MSRVRGRYPTGAQNWTSRVLRTPLANVTVCGTVRRSIFEAAAAILGEGGRLISTDEREVLRARLSEAFVAFAANGGYELPGAALCAVAS